MPPLLDGHTYRGRIRHYAWTREEIARYIAEAEVCAEPTDSRGVVYEEPVNTFQKTIALRESHPYALWRGRMRYESEIGRGDQACLKLVFDEKAGNRPLVRRKEASVNYPDQVNGITQQVLDSVHSGFVRTGLATAYVHLDELLAAGVSSEQKREIRAQLAAACYANTEPDECPRGSMMFLGNPNMPTNRFFILPLAAALIPDHHLAKEWMEVSRQYVRFQLTKNTDPAGTWSEAMHYQAVGYVPVLHGAYALKVNGLLDDSLARLAALPTQYMLRLMSPIDPPYG